MKSHEFYAKYANLPLVERNILIGDIEPLTANLIYREIKAIDDIIRPHVIRKAELIRVFENSLLNKEKNNGK